MSDSIDAKTMTPREVTLLRALSRVRLSYDAVTQHDTGRRKAPLRETDGEDGQLTEAQRLTVDAIARDMMRNAAPFGGLMRRFEVDAIGIGPKLQTHLTDAAADWGAAVVSWINEDWCKGADANDDTPFSEMVSQALIASKTDGDILWVFDDFDRDDGTIRVCEGDQLVTVSDWDAKSKAGDRRTFPWKERNPEYRRRSGKPLFIALEQKNGVLWDSRGRVWGYAFTSEHGKSRAPLEDVTIVPQWNIRRNQEGSARLFKRHWRKSRRGTPESASISILQTDLYEMIVAELQSAKQAATRSGWTETPLDAGLPPLEQALMRCGLDPEKILALAASQEPDAESITLDSLDDLVLNQTGNQERMEALTGGYWDYPPAGQKLHMFDNQRPNPTMAPFADWLQVASGFRLGLGRSRATGKAETSYTAFRGEDLMSWATFYWDQKSIERRLLDFVLYKAVSWGARVGEIPPPPAAYWWKGFSWTMPKMQEVDREKVARAKALENKLGELDFAGIWGPNWRARAEAFGEQMELIRRLDLPLSIRETAAGAELRSEADPNL